VLGATQVGVLTLGGQNLTETVKPSIEVSMHLAVYRQNPAVRAIVHAHPPIASAFSATTRQINCRLIAEAYAVVGAPVCLRYARMGTTELARIVAEGLLSAPCALLANHGVLTTGNSPLEAFDRLEVLEAAAMQTLVVHLLGERRELNAAQLLDLDDMLGNRSGSISRSDRQGGSPPKDGG
jgi:L-fuculose-phosphate aldolase